MPGVCMALGSKTFQYSISFTGWVSPGATRTATAHSNAQRNGALVPLGMTVQFGHVISRPS